MVAVVALVVVAWTATYELVLADRWATWGTTVAEASGPMPGDHLVSEPVTVTTRAVAVEAPPQEVWPWIAQFGIGRGGLYSYDRLENLVGIPVRSATAIDPTLQDLRVGQTIRYTPEGYPLDMRYQVVQVEPPHVLVLRTPAAERASGDTTIAWHVVADGPERSRVLLRWRSASAGAFADTVNHLVGPVSYLMERKELLTIADRASRP